MIEGLFFKKETGTVKTNTNMSCCIAQMEHELRAVVPVRRGGQAHSLALQDGIRVE